MINIILLSRYIKQLQYSMIDAILIVLVLNYELITMQTGCPSGPGRPPAAGKILPPGWEIFSRRTGIRAVLQPCKEALQGCEEALQGCEEALQGSMPPAHGWICHLAPSGAGENDQTSRVAV
jgi:hypothetical protein